MFSDFSIFMVPCYLSWILVSRDFILKTVLLLLHFNMSELREFFGCSCASNSCCGVGWIAFFSLCFRLLIFLNLHRCRIFLAAVSLLWISLLMALNYSWFEFDFVEVSVLLISLVGSFCYGFVTELFFFFFF